MVESEEIPDAALEARQRRMERRRTTTKKFHKDEDDDEDDDESYQPEYQDSEEEQALPGKKRKTPLSQIRGIKKQARYEPEVPMGKEDLAAWRKEARRVRNRESAAASRQKTRSRIEELEGQVDVLQSKYDAALQRIAELEQGRDSTLLLPEPTKVLSTFETIQEDSLPNQVSPPLSPREVKEVLPGASQWSLPQQQAAQALADSLTFSLDGRQGSPPPSSSSQQQRQQSPVKISRPTAV